MRRSALFFTPPPVLGTLPAQVGAFTPAPTLTLVDEASDGAGDVQSVRAQVQLTQSGVETRVIQTARPGCNVTWAIQANGDSALSGATLNVYAVCQGISVLAATYTLANPAPSTVQSETVSNFACDFFVLTVTPVGVATTQTVVTVESFGVEASGAAGNSFAIIGGAMRRVVVTNAMSPYAAQSGTVHWVDTTAGPVEIDIAALTNQQWIDVVDYGGQSAVNAITVKYLGGTITGPQGAGVTYVMGLQYGSVMFQSNGAGRAVVL